MCVVMTAPAAGESPLADVAARAGLTAIAARPPLTTYLRGLWQRRYFIVAFASARNLATFAGARLGQLWQVLTPLLNAGIYFFVFGVLLQTKRDIHNFIGFLIIGIFIFTYTQHCVISGSRAISGHLSLIRALHFPRACLPLASTVQELQQLGISMGIMIVIVLATGEPVTWAWLLLAPILLLQTMFNLGAAFFMARIGAKLPDVTQLLPFLLRTWLYVSGVFYSISRFTEHSPGWVRTALDANPVGAYIELVRDVLLDSHKAPSSAWPYAIGWAVVSLIGGFAFFYRGEVTYGRG
jgi:teichoic acid transport system permease protein